MAIRDLSADLRDTLLKESPFVYAHLVKFERPKVTSAEIPTTTVNDYVYLTDGSFDIEYDDSDDGVSNAQTYIANKVLNVGSISETIEARATNFTLQIDGTALDTTLTDSVTIVTTSGGKGHITSSEDLVSEGFREGDLVKLVAATGSNKDVTVRIDSFESANKKINVTVIDGATDLVNETHTYTLTFKNPEVEGILSSRSNTGYARYINRDVIIYKAFINPETGAIIGTPYTLFKGIIAGGKVKEDPMKNSTITWNITSHWGDYNRVSGRLTSDAHHRALDANKRSDPNVLIRPAYKNDLGFYHSEQALNLVAIYQIKETKQELKMKRKWYGSKKYKLIEYEIEVDRDVDLRFNLEAKYLPVIYGVNKIDSIPVFVDTLNDDARVVFVAYAICEGQVGGLYDIYFDDTPSICIDANDSDTRSVQTAENTIDVLCTGRMDAGDTLASKNVNSATTVVVHAPPSNTSLSPEDREANETNARDEEFYVPITDPQIGGGTVNSAAGILHGKGTTFDRPIDTSLRFHAGRADQKADSLLVTNAPNFKIGNDYYDNANQYAYWGPNHRLLDTAYVVCKYTIGEGETTIPQLNFVIRGKGVNSYNYDYSYVADPTYTDDATVFNLGQTVHLKKTSDDSYVAGTESASSVQIADIFTLTNIEGQIETRVRFASKPPIGTETAFFLSDGTNNLHLVTWDHIGHSGTIPSMLQEEITAVADTTVSGGAGIDITGTFGAAFEAGITIGGLPSFAFTGDGSTAFDEAAFEQFLQTFTFEDTFTSGDNALENVGSLTENADDLVGEFITIMDAVQLASNASSSDDAYNNRIIEITYNIDGGTRVETRKITDYDGATRVAKLESALEYAPTANDTYKIFTTTPDVRVSTNPAMQLLDYLSSKRYGRDLDVDTDIDKESFLAAARECDTRSNVFVVSKTEPTDGDSYYYEDSDGGKVLFYATVKSSSAVSIYPNQTHYLVEFENVFGKLAHRWESWKGWFAGELYYNNGVLHKVPTGHTAGATITYSSGANTTTGINLKKAGSPSTLLALDIARKELVDENGILSNTPSNVYTFDGNPIVKKVSAAHGDTSANSGYSLYDSDDVKYWRYLGWEAQNQRHVTRHQTNAIIDTSSSVFENINSMLKHFNGILRYSAGKYNLSVMTTAGDATSVTVDGTTYKVEEIDESDIIGSIQIEDAGQKGTYNSVDVGITDPYTGFEGRTVNMFNSEYLKQDRMVPRKGSFQSPSVTNYYNARINAKQYLDQSRSGLKISFTMVPKGALLLAGEVIRLTYNRFGWSNKFFRITNLAIKQDCLIQITAEEHDDSTYIVEAELGSSLIVPEGVRNVDSAPAGPSGLTATADKRGGILLSWTNASNFDVSTHDTQIWRSDDNDRANAELIANVNGTSHVDPIVDGGANTRYYWIRHTVLRQSSVASSTTLKKVFSAYHPTSSTNGVNGTSQDNRGEKGATGTKGEEGPKGQTGEDGTSVTIVGNISTVGSTPQSALNSAFPSASAGEGVIANDTGDLWVYDGTSWNNVGQIKGPKGTQGQKGSRGPKGTQGDKGIVGSKGQIGSKGEAGTKGAQGTAGEKGSRGPKGVKGTKGTEGPKGDKGTKGIQGTKGVKGTQGTVGPKGSQGDTGPKGIQGTQGDKGVKGTVGDTGPKGIQGTQGDKGPKGTTGAKGDKGTRGTQGDKGPKGTTGAKGDKGTRGTQGDKGPKGTTGAKGDKGTRGTQGDKGPKGTTGAKGDKGTQGTQGEPGPKGTVGDKGEPGTKGVKGTTGPKGTVGDKGEPGTKGVKGTTGPKGTVGDKGEPGTKGVKGTTGPKGTVGDKGEPGTKGVQGTEGPKGTTGDKGEPGPKGSQGDIGPKGTTGDKGEPGPKGSQGDTGPKGTTGAKGDKGTRGVKGTIGPKGTEGAKGDKGTRGPKGTAGPKGEPGAKGDPGPKGTQGEPGTKGAKGTAGDPGPKGTQGDPGPKGEKGTTPGPKGPQGTQGDPGPKGEKGTTPGPKGEPGAKGEPGPKGTQGDPGTKGVKGTEGDTGPKGTTGDKGEPGTKGVQGTRGPKGTVGDKGEPGTKGVKGTTGPKGTVGDKGEPGTKGVKGTTGPKGTVGDKGEPGTKGVKGTTGPKGTVGDKGEPGTKGVKGTTGPKGTVGDKGEPGTKGVKGTTGPKGTTGDKGEPGTKGVKGTTGPKGTVGDKGEPGTKGVKGTTGPKGTVGDKGEPGTKGVKGTTGPKGTVGDKGEPGTKGVKGTTGPKGTTGDKGEPGTKGPKGSTGPKGSRGPKGTKGVAGSKGAPGSKGSSGDKGVKGVTGASGPKGTAGAAGNAIVFDTDATIQDDTGSGVTKADLIRSFRNADEVLTNDVYWHIQSGRVFQYQGNTVTTADVAFEELTGSTGTGFISADAIKVSSANSRLEIRSDVIKIFQEVSGTSVLRVKIGNLS